MSMASTDLSSSVAENSAGILQDYLLVHCDENRANHLRKRRWFLFKPEQGKLYYYRTKEDLFPLGEIDIRQASFVLSPPGSAGLDAFRFEIRSGTKQLVLEAKSASQGFHWVGALQQFRHNYFIQMESEKSLDQDRSYFCQPVSTGNPDPPLIDFGPSTKKTTGSSQFYCDILDEKMPVRPLKSRPSPKIMTKKESYKRTQSLPPGKQNLNQLTAKTTIDGTASNRKSGTGIFSAMFNSTQSRLNSRDEEPPEVCRHCGLSPGDVVSLRHDKVALEDEVKTNREVIKILQEQLRIFNCEKNTAVGVEDSGHGGGGEDTVLALKAKLSLARKENQQLADENRALVASKQVLEEMLQSRDQTLVTLTHEVYDLELKNSRMQTHAELEREFIQDEVPRKIKQKMEQLEDTAVAFEQQNYFLNKEIIELNEIRQVLETKNKQSESKLCEVEAKCSQIQSKLLALLKEINQCIQEEERNRTEQFHNIDRSTSTGGNDRSFVSNESVKQLVSRLLQESSLDIPLSWKPGNRPRWSIGGSQSASVPEYDELGFYHRGENQPRCSYDLVLDPDKNEMSWRSKWDHFMSNLSGNGSGQLPMGDAILKHMIRFGVPQDYRCKIWRSFIHHRVQNQKSKLGSPDYYESLLRGCSGSNQTNFDPSAKQIELDLLRTLPNNRHFENLESDGVERLRRVLLAYSVHNPKVGYCQGLNRLAAVALLFMPEEDAFWCLVAIVEHIMPDDYYGRNLMGAHVDQYVMRDLIADKLPQLFQHMERHQIEISLFAWFLTIFVDNVPVYVYLHIWDVFLHEGSKVLFRFALAILRQHEQELLQMNDSASMNQFLRTLDQRPHFDLVRLSEIAFRGLNPFPSRSVRAKRLHYTAMVVQELRKMEDFRTSLTASQESPSKKESTTATSIPLMQQDENESD